MLDSALSVRNWKFRYQAQSEIANHGYRTKCQPLDTTDNMYMYRIFGTVAEDVSIFSISFYTAI
jgi:hypothetical protein